MNIRPRTLSLVSTTLVLLVLCWPADIRAKPFEQGSFSVSLRVATGGFGSDRYYVIGASTGFFVVDGLELGLTFEQWFGAEPDISKLSPHVRYVFHFVPTVHPYLGAFYRHWFIGSNIDDVDTLGARLGFLILAGSNFVVGGGVVYEHIVSECQDDCWDIYPELIVSLMF